VSEVAPRRPLTVTSAAAVQAAEAAGVLVASVLVALPLLIDADDPIAHALEGSAALLCDPSAGKLREGAALRRHTADAPPQGEAPKGISRAWRSLLKLAEARVRLERARTVAPAGLRNDVARGGSAMDSVVSMLDGKIAAHVAALTRAYTAADTARAAELGLDDAAARGVDAAGETLEDVSRAIMEIKV